MMNKSTLWRGLAVAAIGGLAATTQADVIYQTDDPFGGFFGVLGTDVFENESKAVRFTPGADYALTQFSVWFWHNGGPGTAHPNVTLTLRPDAGSGDESFPSDVVIETWVVDVSSAVPFEPELFTLFSDDNPRLDVGVNYWIVAEAPDAPALDDPVWAFAAIGNGFTSIGNPNTGVWQPGGYGAVMTLTVEGNQLSDHYGLDISDPFRGGRMNTFTVSGARPNATTWLAFSLEGYGETPVPPLGVTLNLASPSQAGGSVMTDANGDVRWDLFVPSQASGLRVWLQSVQQGARSRVVEVLVD